MRIAHIRDVYLRVTFIHHYLVHFRRHDHIVLCREIKDRDVFPYAHVAKTSALHFPAYLLDKILTLKLGWTRRLVNDWWAYRGAIKRLGGDISVLHAHMGTQGFYAVPLSRRTGIPLVVTFYGGDMSNVPKIPGWMDNYKELFATAALILVEGPYMRERMIDLGCPGHKVKVSRLAVPVKGIKFNLRPSLGGEEPLRILMCAGFVRKKGFLDAMDTLGALKQAGRVFHCDIIGDGPLKNEIMMKRDELGLAPHITFHGKVVPSRIFEIAERAHLFFHPSKTGPDGDSEGGAPTVCSEMQAAGLPIIATTHADIPNVIPEENHFLAAEGDVQGLVRQFERFLAVPGQWEAISKRGRAFVEANHDGFVCSAKLEEYYDSVIA